MADEFEPTKWWRVIDPHGVLWCETSDKDEAIASMRPDDRLQRRYIKIEYEWRTVENESPNV